MFQASLIKKYYEMAYPIYLTKSLIACIEISIG